VLSLGLAGKPKPRVLCLDGKGEVLTCKDNDSKGKDYSMPIQGLQVRISLHIITIDCHSCL
jgi:hypothetical protein